jgi:hypothetical protein
MVYEKGGIIVSSYEDRLNILLMEYVAPDGKVDYEAINDTKTVEDYIEWLKTFDPETLKTKNEKLTFWINAYNMLTIYGVIKKLKDDPQFAEKGHKSFLQRVKFFWRTKYEIGGKKYSLYHIENKILRKMNEPRIHFALNCASGSCPLLKDGLYSAENLDQELELATKMFIQSPTGVLVDKERKTVHMSQIFKWYKKDFTKAAKNVLEYVKKYLQDDDRKFVEDNASEIKISYKEYDWGLNIVN